MLPSTAFTLLELVPPLVFSTMPLATKRPTTWSVAGEIRVISPPEKKLPTRSNSEAVITDEVQTSNSVQSATAVPNGLMKREMTTEQYRSHPTLEVTNKINNNANVANRILAVWKTRTLLNPSSCEYWKMLSPPLDDRCNLQQGQNGQYQQALPSSGHHLVVGTQQAEGSLSGRKCTTFSEKTSSSYRDLSPSQDKEADQEHVFDDPRPQQLVTNTNTSFVPPTQPFVYHVSAKISPVKPPAPKVKSILNKENVAASPSAEKNVYLSVKSSDGMPEMHNKDIQTDDEAPVPLLSTDQLSNSFVEVKALADCQSLKKSAFQLNMDPCQTMEGNKVDSGILPSSDSSGNFGDDRCNFMNSNSETSETNSGKSFSKCNSKCYVAISKGTKGKSHPLNKCLPTQNYSWQNCPPSTFPMETKCQLTQTSVPSIVHKTSKEITWASQLTQTEEKEWKTPILDEDHNLFPFYLAFRFACLILNNNNNNQDCFANDAGFSTNTVEKEYSQKRRYWPKRENGNGVTNKTTEYKREAAFTQVRERSHKPKRKQRWCNYPNSIYYQRTLPSTNVHEPRLWYNRNYRKRPQNFKIVESEAFTELDNDLIPKRAKTYQRRKPNTNAIQNITRNSKLSLSSSSEEERREFNLAFGSTNEDDCCSHINVGEIGQEMSKSAKCQCPSKQKPNGRDTLKGNLSRGKCLESMWPNCDQLTPSSKTSKESEGSRKNWIRRTINPCAACRDALINFLCGVEFVPDNKEHESATSVTKLLFRKYHSLGSGTSHKLKCEPSSASSSTVTSGPLIPTATVTSFLDGKAQSAPGFFCMSSMMSREAKSLTSLRSNNLNSNGEESLKKTVTSFPTNDTPYLSVCGNTPEYTNRQDYIKVLSALPFNCEDSHSGLAGSSRDHEFNKIPQTAKHCKPDFSTVTEFLSTHPECTAECFPVASSKDSSSPNRASQFHSDSIVKWTDEYSSMPYQPGRWPALRMNRLEGRLSGGADRGTHNKIDVAGELDHAECDPLTEMPDLQCEPTGADQTVVYTCNECCKSCTTTSGWACHTSDDCGSGVFMQTDCNPSCSEDNPDRPRNTTWFGVLPGGTRHCTSTYKAKGKCEIPEMVEEEEPPNTLAKNCTDWVDCDPFVPNEPIHHEIPPSYDYSFGPNSYYQTGRTSLSAGGQSKRPSTAVNRNASNCGQWWYLPAYQNGWNMNSCYDQESACFWPPMASCQGWGRNSDWCSQQFTPSGPEQTWTYPQNVFKMNEQSSQARGRSSEEAKETPFTKRRTLIQPSVRKPRLRQASAAVVRDCGSQINTLHFEDNETPVSRSESPPQAEGYCSPDCYRHSCEPGVVFDCSTQTNISKVERPPGFTAVVHYNVREPQSSPSTETGNFRSSHSQKGGLNPSPVPNAMCSSPEYTVRSPSPEECASSPLPTKNVMFISPVQNVSSPSPVQNIRHPSPGENNHSSSFHNPDRSSPERIEPRAFSSSPYLAKNASPESPPCASAQMGEQPSEGHDCPQEGKNGLVTDVMKSVQGFRNCLNCGTNQNVHYNRKGVYAVRVISNGKESQNKTNQCVHYKWLPSIPWPTPADDVPCDSEVYYDSRTCRNSDEEPVQETQESVSWKKEFRRRGAVTSGLDKRAAGGGGGGRQHFPQEELLSLHNNSHQWGSTYGKMFDVENCLQKDLKRRRGLPVGLPELPEHDLCCNSEVSEEENPECYPEWTGSCDGEDVYSYYHQYNNRNEANCNLVEEHNEVTEYNRCNDLPSPYSSCSLTPTEAGTEEETAEAPMPAIIHMTTNHRHHKRPTKKVRFEEPCCQVAVFPAQEEPSTNNFEEPSSPTTSYAHTEHICPVAPTKTAYFQECCKATQTPSPTSHKDQHIVSTAVAPSTHKKTISPATTVPSPHRKKQADSIDPDVNITDICITGPSCAGSQCSRCGCPCRSTLLRPGNCTCRVKSVVCACNENNPGNIDCLVECGCNANVPNYNECYNNYPAACGYHYCFPNYMNYGCYCCPPMHYHNTSCYIVPTNFGGMPPFEMQNPVQAQCHTPSPARFKDSYKPEDWTPEPIEPPEPEEVTKEEKKETTCKDENKTFVLRCKHRTMNESPSGKITIHDCEVTEDSRRFIPGNSCAENGRLDCGRTASGCYPRMAHATTSGSPLLEVLAQNEEVIRAAKDCLKRTVNYMAVAKGGSMSADNLYPRRRNSPGAILPDYLAMKTGLYQRCQVIDKISDESINLDVDGVDPPAETAPSRCLLNSLPINDRNVESLLLFDPACDVARRACDDVSNPCDGARESRDVANPALENPCDQENTNEK